MINRTNTAYISEISSAGQKILLKLSQFKKLHDNWDGSGAIAPSNSVIQRAEQFLIQADQLELPIFFAAPGPNGEVLLESKREGDAAESYFEENNVGEMILYRENIQVYTGNIELNSFMNHFK